MTVSPMATRTPETIAESSRWIPTSPIAGTMFGIQDSSGPDDTHNPVRACRLHGECVGGREGGSMGRWLCQT